jgi:hypothetical protein
MLPLEVRLLMPDAEGKILGLAFDVHLGTSDKNVLIGRGELGPIARLHSDDHFISAPVTCSHESLALLIDPPPGRVNLVLRFNGLLSLRHGSKDSDGDFRVLEPDIWHILPVGENNHQLELSAARSDWYEQVVEPMKLGRYLITPLYLPNDVLGWDAALTHLDEARRALTNGNAPAVFGRCRAALDALPGDKTKIFDGLPEGPRRKEIDALTRAIGKYIHSGRHVAPGSADVEPGEFPVDQRDAVFVYNMTMLLLSQIASVLLKP